MSPSRPRAGLLPLLCRPMSNPARDAASRLDPRPRRPKRRHPGLSRPSRRAISASRESRPAKGSSAFGGVFSIDVGSYVSRRRDEFRYFRGGGRPTRARSLAFPFLRDCGAGEGGAPAVGRCVRPSEYSALTGRGAIRAASRDAAGTPEAAAACRPVASAGRAAFPRPAGAPGRRDWRRHRWPRGSRTGFGRVCGNRPGGVSGPSRRSARRNRRGGLARGRSLSRVRRLPDCRRGSLARGRQCRVPGAEGEGDGRSDRTSPPKHQTKAERVCWSARSGRGGRGRDDLLRRRRRRAAARAATGSTRRANPGRRL